MGVGASQLRRGAALVAAAVVLAGCGASGPSVCSRWGAQTASDHAAAVRYGNHFASQFAGLPGDSKSKLASIAHASAASYFRLEVAEDLAKPRWRHATRCPAPRF